MDSTINNRVYMKLWIENVISYLPNKKSVFLIEEISNRQDYRVIGKKMNFNLSYLLFECRRSLIILVRN